MGNSITGSGMRNVGILFLLGFGLIWFLVGIANLGLSWPPTVGLSLAYLGSGMITASLLRRFVRSTKVAPMQPEDAWQRRFNRVGLFQALAILLAVVLLVSTSLPQLIPAVVCLIVGAHFFPLANIFNIALYRITATVLCITAVAGLAVAVAEGLEMSQTLVGVGAALILWFTAIALAPGDPSRVSFRST